MSKPRQHSKSHGRRAEANDGLQQSTYDQVLPRMIAYINNLKPGCIRLKDLRHRFNDFSLSKLWSYIRINPANFQIQKENNEELNSPSDNDVVWVKTELRLCEKHCRKGQNCLGDCEELHLCRTFLLLGDMCCPFQKSGKICAFGHNLRTNHNSRLLDKHCLDFMSDNELRVLFRRRICRSVSTMPQICIYYNGKGGKGCSNKRCRSLHLCLDFVQERCLGKCRKNHSMSDDQVAFTLDLFAIDKSWPNDMVLEDLRSIMRKRIRHESDVYSVVSEDSSHHDETNDISDDDSYDYAAGGDERTNANHCVAKCCSHCLEMKAYMIEMKEKVEDLEKQIDILKTSVIKTPQSSEKEEEEIVEDDHFSLDEKQMLAQQLSPIVKEMEPKLCEQITKMIIDLDKSQLKDILTSQDNLRSKIKEAAQLLKSFQGK